MSNYYSGRNEKYLRNMIPHHILNDNFRQDNKYIRPVGDRDFWESAEHNVKSFYIKKAEEYLDYEWKSISVSKMYLDFFEKGKGDEVLHVEKRNALGFLAAAECFENKGRFIRSIVDGIFSICEETTWAVAAHFRNCSVQKETVPDPDDPILDLRAAITAALLAMVYGTLKEKLDDVSPIICRRIEKELEKRIFEPYLESDEHWWMGFNTDLSFWSINNWNTHMNYHIMYAALAVCSDKGRCLKIVNRAIDSLDMFVDAYPDDGACDEGHGYWFGAPGTLSWAIGLLDHIIGGKSRITENKKIYKMMKYILNVRIDGLNYASVADSHGKSDIPSEAAYILYNIGEVFNDRAFKNEAYELYKYKEKDKEKNFSPLRLFFETVYSKEIVKEPDYSRADVKKSWMSGIQMLSSHEKLQTDSGFYFNIKGGHNRESHNHNDVGSYMVFLDGQPIVLDPGIGTYTKNTFGENRYKEWYANGFNHNVPLVGGVEQREGEEYRAENVECIMDDLADKVSMELKNAYSNSDKIVSIKRTGEINRENSSVTVSDEYEFTEDMNYESILMLQNVPKLTDDGIESGECKIKIQSDVPYSVSFEERILDDCVFSEVWGDKIYKAVIKLENVRKGKLTIMYVR